MEGHHILVESKIAYRWLGIDRDHTSNCKLSSTYLLAIKVPCSTSKTVAADRSPEFYSRCYSSVPLNNKCSIGPTISLPTCTYGSHKKEFKNKLTNEYHIPSTNTLPSCFQIDAHQGHTPYIVELKAATKMEVKRGQNKNTI